MPPLLLEVIVQTVEDARAAAAGGADRLEVVRAIDQGGLTPPLSLVRAIAAETPLPLRVMVRENAGYAMGAGELPALRRAAAELAEAGVDGLVIGFAEEGEVRLDDLASVLAAAPGVRMTFHRAFDSLRDPLGAISMLAGIAQVDRILTSGGDGTAQERSRRLCDYAARSSGVEKHVDQRPGADPGRRIAHTDVRERGPLIIIAGGGVDAGALALFAGAGCVREAHVGRAAREGNDPEGPVSAARVRKLRELAG